MKQKIACIDLDGTLIHYDDWKGENYFGDVISGSKEALLNLKENNWIIIIYTTRSDKKLISDFLKSNGLSFDYINENPQQPENAIGGKPFADVYIDDRAIQFNGDWKSTVEEMENFQTWESRMNANMKNEEYSREFFKSDFEQSCEQLRHYDSLNWDITKFCFLELLLGIAAVWTIYGFAHAPDNSNTYIASNYTWIIPSIIAVCYLFSFLASFLISRNRVYYVKVARYINEHRQFAFEGKPASFRNMSNYYTNPKLPKFFEIWSTQLVCLYVIQIISAFIFGVLAYYIIAYMVAPKNGYMIFHVISAVLLGMISFVINLYIWISYMNYQDDKKK